MENNINELLNSIDQINPEKKYWIVRTMGGAFYKEFVANGYVAIGYNEVSINEIKFSLTHEHEAQKVLTNIIENKGILDENNNPINSSYASSQLIKFYRDLHVGDTVFIPGESSNELSIGVVTSKTYKADLHKESSGCKFEKRININWIKHTSRQNLPPILQLMFNSRHIVSNVDSYAEHIEAFTKDFFKKNNVTYLVLRVKNENEISWKDLTVINDLFDILKMYVKENNCPVDVDGIKMKISVQSPGDIIMYALSEPGIILLGLIVVFITGGQFKIDRIGFDVSARGLIASIGDFLDRRTDRKVREAVSDKLKNLEIQDPNDLLKFLSDDKNPRKEY